MDIANVLFSSVMQQMEKEKEKKKYNIERISPTEHYLSF